MGSAGIVLIADMVSLTTTGVRLLFAVVGYSVDICGLFSIDFCIAARSFLLRLGI